MYAPLFRRRRRALAVAAAIAAAAALALTAPPASAVSPAGARTVEYHGLRLDVPATWPVVDLTANHDTCVRFDVHAVYLGHPSARQNCPTGLRGRTAALLLEPLDGATATAVSDRSGTSVAATGTAAYVPNAKAVPGEVRFAVPSAGVVATATFDASGGGREGTEAMLRTAKLTADAKPMTAFVRAAPQAGNSISVRTNDTSTAIVAGPQPGTYAGRGFDSCAAPDTGAMSTWTTNSPYKAIGVYIGGVERACAQPNLTAGWASTVTGQGWHLFPIYVGLQAPCTTFGYRVSTDPGTAHNQGVSDADDAVNQANALGLPADSTVYDDMEAYNSGDASCSTGVMNYISGWTDELHARSFVSGEYSSAGSGMVDLVNHVGRGYSLPDQIYFAWWNGAYDTDGGTYIPAGDWANHQRIHQYTRGAYETYGGVTINIDEDYLDVASDSAPPPPPPPSKYWIDTAPDAPSFASPTGTSQTGTLRQGTNYAYCKAWGPVVGTSTTSNHWWLQTDPSVGPAAQWVSAYYLTLWGNDAAKDNTGVDIPVCSGSPGHPPTNKWTVDTSLTASTYAYPTFGSSAGTLNAGTANYAYCKIWGPMVGSSASYNHWWLYTDPDVGAPGQFVSAYYLTRWGNDQALDNSGAVIPDC